MKKLSILLAVAAVAALALTLAACSKKADSQPAATATPESSMDQPATMPDGEVDGAMGVTPETPEAPGEPAAPDEALNAKLEALYKLKTPDLMLATTAVDLASANWTRYYTGLEGENAAKLDAALASEAAIGSQAYSLVLARVKDAADAPAIAQAMLDGIDPVKWICVQADDIRAASSGDLVMLVMADSGLSEAVKADDLLAAFKELNGGKLDAELTRTAPKE